MKLLTEKLSLLRLCENIYKENLHFPSFRDIAMSQVDEIYYQEKRKYYDYRGLAMQGAKTPTSMVLPKLSQPAFSGICTRRVKTLQNIYLLEYNINECNKHILSWTWENGIRARIIIFKIL